ncbi:MAG: PAC2 family protein, partial [Methanoregula sp.]|nr:PAC2 family protein [Methanoregula sp.]
MIEDITVRFLESFKAKRPKDPVMIEGLPGIGQVGKLVAEYMIHMLKPRKIGEITSIYFPPQVILEENGLARLVRNELYLYEDGVQDLIFLIGDHQ